MHPDPKAALARVIIAHASLALAQQRVRECELNFNKGSSAADAAATVAAGELEQAIKAVLTIETTP